MQTVGIQTAQNIDIDYYAAGLGERVIARIIDYSLYLAIYLLYSWLFRDVQSSNVLWNFTLPQILYFTFYGFYDLVAEVFFNGQSLGKFIMKIKVMSLDGTRPRFSQYLIRYVFRAVDFVLTLGIGAIISVAMTDNKQRIGDILAGTTLVKTKRRTETEDLGYIATDIEYVPVFREVTLLKDSDIALIHEVIATYNKTGSNLVLDNMGKRVREHLEITIPPNMNMHRFLMTLLKDYHHLTTHAN